MRAPALESKGPHVPFSPGRLDRSTRETGFERHADRMVIRVFAQRSGHEAVTLSVPRSGTGTFKLIPGDYTFEVRVPPGGICDARARIAGGQRVDVTVTCPVP
jgi:hypothetical protein